MNKSALSQIENRVKQLLESHFEDISGPGFVVGVSGGPDSMALLYIFRQLGIDATVVHINYQKRDKESDKDQEMVEQMAGMWGYDCHSIRIDSKQADGHNFQQWAREQRYRLFRDLMKEYGRDGIAVAHHRDDQIETIMQKLFRGSGPESWQGMKVWDGELFRPLLDFGRDEIMKYIDDHAVPYRTDQSNLESDFARNLLRNEWLSKLEEYFPGWEQNILNLPERAGLFGKTLQHIAAGMVHDGRKIDRHAFTAMDADLQKALILHLIKELDPGAEISAHALGRLKELSSLQTGKAVQLNSRWSVVRDREWLQLDSDETGGRPQEKKLGKQELAGGTARFGNLVFSIEAFSDPDYDHVLYLDTATIGFPLVVRRWKEGDTFQPLGMSGRQKVSDHLANRKISAVHKEEALVVESADGELAAVLFPPDEKEGAPGTISERVRCSASTSECVVIRRGEM